MNKVKNKWSQYWAHKSTDNSFKLVDKISMLHVNALIELNRYAAISKGPIVEVGAYIGGSTIALSKGSRYGVITFEKGGSYLSHPQLPSSDILKDLRGNLKAFACQNVSIIPHSTDDGIGIEMLVGLLESKKIGLLFMDADGNVEHLIKKLSAYMTEETLVVIDDFWITDGNLKSDITNKQVLKLVEEGVLIEDKVVGWGTWFGKINKLIR